MGKPPMVVELGIRGVVASGAADLMRRHAEILTEARIKLTTDEVRTLCDALNALYTSTQPGLQAAARALAKRLQAADMVLLMPPALPAPPGEPEAHGARRRP